MYRQTKKLAKKRGLRHWHKLRVCGRHETRPFHKTAHPPGGSCGGLDRSYSTGFHYQLVFAERQRGSDSEIRYSDRGQNCSRQDPFAFLVFAIGEVREYSLDCASYGYVDRKKFARQVHINAMQLQVVLIQYRNVQFI